MMAFDAAVMRNLSQQANTQEKSQTGIVRLTNNKKIYITYVTPKKKKEVCVSENSLTAEIVFADYSPSGVGSGINHEGS